ncbi:hypothetical protein JOF39_001466 [Glutamicibacter protophormiae]|uniref:Uncharacterized protein n=1 Tax=Glutamicibacter protophormiae TaxID=37930 RepID=A0ABS4XPS5_GLUPR|nr:hypothetical protein [Glutamicibacter protophormiae]
MLVPLLLAVAAINLSRIPGLAGYPGVGWAVSGVLLFATLILAFTKYRHQLNTGISR